MHSCFLHMICLIKHVVSKLCLFVEWKIIQHILQGSITDSNINKSKLYHEGPRKEASLKNEHSTHPVPGGNRWRHQVHSGLGPGPQRGRPVLVAGGLEVVRVLLPHRVSLVDLEIKVSRCRLSRTTERARNWPWSPFWLRALDHWNRFWPRRSQRWFRTWARASASAWA